MLSLLLLLVQARPTAAPPCEGAPSWATAFAPNLVDSARLFRGTFSPDGQTLYYFRKATLNREDYRILVARRTPTGWSHGERLDLGGDFSDLYPTVSPDGRRLVFASYRPAPGDTAARPNAYLWYAERTGNGWGPPRFIGMAAQFGNYHSGPIIEADYSIRFHRTSSDWRTVTELVTRWDGKGYRAPEASHPARRWKDWRPGEYYVWGVRQVGDDLQVLDISPLDARGRRGPAQVWVSLRQGEDWSEPWPAGGGVNQGGWANFVTPTRDGCSILYVRDFTRFETVSLEALTAPARTHAGEVGVGTLPRIEGVYRGAYIQAGGVQLVDAEILRQGDTTLIATVTPDWPLRPSRIVPLTRDSSERYRFATPFGEAALRYDRHHGELTGAVLGNDLPPITLTLKRSLMSARPQVVRESVTVESGGVTLAGTFVRPAMGGVGAALLVIPGRGCVTRAAGVRLLEALAPYGVAGIALDKRGVGQSGGNCRYGTIDDFTGDALAGYEALRRRIGSDSVNVGLLGTSAGGWTAVRAAARAPMSPDFVVMVAGPPISVEEQQRLNARYITRRLGFSPAQERQAMRYLDLMFMSGRQEARYREMREIVAWAGQVGFAEEFFVDSDIPASPGAVDSLWVTLNNYDPAADLRRLKLPLLAFFGEEDEIVPPRENVAALRRAGAANPDLQTRIVVVPGGDHGMGVSGGVGHLHESEDVHRFDRLSAVYLQTLVDFLGGLAAKR